MREPVLELGVLIPGAAFCLLAAAGHLRLGLRRTLLWTGAALGAVCLGGGWLCWRLGCRTGWLELAAILAGGLAYVRGTDLPAWRSVSVFLGVCGVYTSISGLGIIVDGLTFPEGSGPWLSSLGSPWLSAAGSLTVNALFWAVVLLCWYPTTHCVRDLLNSDVTAGTWYVFWVLPLAFVVMSYTLSRVFRGLVAYPRMMAVYGLLCLAITVLLLLFYLLFYLVARELERSHLLRRENQFLQMQTAQYEALETAIAETRQARHDLRHHFHTLSALAEREAWADLRRYLAQAVASVPAEGLPLCENRAVDGVAGWYAALSRQEDIPFSCRLQLPQDLPVPEMDLCVVLQNLLENALEASRHTQGQRYIHLQAAPRGEHMVLLSVENAWSGTVTQRDGVFLSSKRPGPGVGLQSVAHIAGKNGGFSRFFCQDGVFTAQVLLRGPAS